MTDSSMLDSFTWSWLVAVESIGVHLSRYVELCWETVGTGKGGLVLGRWKVMHSWRTVSCHALYLT